MGRKPSETKLKIETKLRDFKLLALPAKETLVSIALENRPDLRALKVGVNKSDADEQLARAQKWDNFTITAGLSQQGPTDANPADSTSNSQAAATSWNAGITIPLPFFNRNQGNIQKAILTRDQTRHQIEAKSLAIRQEIEGLYDQLVLGKSLIEDYEGKQLKRARDVRDAQQRQFGTGNSALLDYLDALSAYQGSVSAYYDAVADYRRNLARLNASLGKEWQP